MNEQNDGLRILSEMKANSRSKVPHPFTVLKILTTIQNGSWMSGAEISLKYNREFMLPDSTGFAYDYLRAIVEGIGRYPLIEVNDQDIPPERTSFSPWYRDKKFRIKPVYYESVVNFLPQVFELEESVPGMPAEGVHSLERVTVVSEERRVDYGHEDIVNDLMYIGNFFGYSAQRGARVNEILPESERLEREKELDGIWTFNYPLVGKVKIPFEVQISGSIEDTVVRLASVSDYSYKLMVVASAKEQQIVRSMINRFNIPPEKMIYFSPEEVLTIRKSLEKAELLREKLMDT